MIKLNVINSGRGSQINPHNRFESLHRTELVNQEVKTRFTSVEAKTIVNRVNSPDIPFSYSANPYQGCEHGCVYCYARPTHNYWGYSSGLDFESKILVKVNAPDLLDKQLRAKNWDGGTISFSGNTDCYQPAEKHYGLTRQMLQICLKRNQSVGIITKNRLITRDLDIIEQLNRKRLVAVAVSITSLDDELRRKLEPRASSVDTRLKTVKELTHLGIPTMVMMAPIIPGLNDHEIIPTVAKLAEMGVDRVGYTVIRLNNDLDIVFEQWLNRYFPDRKNKVLNAIKSCHAGALKDNQFGHRMSGSGQVAKNISNLFRIARNRYMPNPKQFELDVELYHRTKNNQLTLF